MEPDPEVPQGSRRVLLIEPGHEIRQQMRNWLISGQVDVCDATDLSTGLHACQAFRPDLIVSQLHLPRQNALTLLSHLQNDPRTESIPVLFYADHTTSAERVRAFDQGAVDILSRPFVGDEFLARVRSALKTRSLMMLLEKRANIDGLTGLSNRNALRERSPREWDSCRRHGRSIAFLISDLDHFKKVNDVFGHAAGDLVLHQAAQALARSVRIGDFVARYGGEEFAVIAPTCTVEGALVIAERFRSRLADTVIMYKDTPIQVTASVGVAATSDLAALDPETLLKRADQALYAAKHASRNAVWFWDGSIDRPSAATEVLSQVG